PERESRLWNLFMPFTYKVWLTIIGTIVGCSLIAWLFAFFSPFSAFNLGADYAVADEVWLKEYLWSCIGSFLQQGQDFYPFAMSARAVLASWWFFITLDDLVTQTAVTPYVRRGTNLFDLLSNAQSGVYKQLAEQVVLYDPDVESCPSNPPRADQACVEDYSALLAIALKNCTQYYVANEQFNTGTIAFMFPEDAPYANLFNFHLQKLHESGQIQRWFDIYWSKDNGCKDETISDTDPINFEGIGGCCIVTCVFYGLGLLILLLELLWTKVLKRQTQESADY
uniref:PBPe domain-containing protein n=1 Tax=Macrostomum lignano TaxID=282301 RepID=A0A1I8JLH1_9PLAT